VVHEAVDDDAIAAAIDHGMAHVCGLEELLIGRDVSVQIVGWRGVSNMEARWVEADEGISFELWVLWKRV
jgi:hypothetical protein